MVTIQAPTAEACQELGPRLVEVLSDETLRGLTFASTAFCDIGFCDAIGDELYDTSFSSRFSEAFGAIPEYNEDFLRALQSLPKNLSQSDIDKIHDKVRDFAIKTPDLRPWFIFVKKYADDVVIAIGLHSLATGDNATLDSIENFFAGKRKPIGKIAVNIFRSFSLQTS